MRKTSLIVALFALTLTCLVSAQNTVEKKKLTWPESAVAKFGDNPTKEHRAAIDAGLPSATAKSAKERKLLVFYRCDGFVHSSIPFGNYAMEALARETGAFSVDLADKYLSLIHI